MKLKNYTLDTTRLELEKDMGFIKDDFEKSMEEHRKAIDEVDRQVMEEIVSELTSPKWWRDQFRETFFTRHHKPK